MRWLSEMTWRMVNQVFQDLTYHPQRVLRYGFWLLLFVLMIVLAVLSVFDGSMFEAIRESQ